METISKFFSWKNGRKKREKETKIIKRGLEARIAQFGMVSFSKFYKKVIKMNLILISITKKYKSRQNKIACYDIFFIFKNLILGMANEISIDIEFNLNELYFLTRRMVKKKRKKKGYIRGEKYRGNNVNSVMAIP